MLYYLYIMPCAISLIYFILLKIQDFIHNEESYTKNTLSFKKTLLMCFIPVINIFIAFTVLITIMKSIMCPMDK